MVSQKSVNQTQTTPPRRMWLRRLTIAAGLLVILIAGFSLHRNPQPEPLLRFDAGLKSIPTSVSFSRDDKLLACAFAVEKGYRVTDAYGSLKVWRSGEVRIYDVSNGHTIRTLYSGKELSDITFTKDGNFVHANENQTIRWWRLADGSPIRRLTTIGRVLTFSPDEKFFLTACSYPNRSDEMLLLCNAETGKVVRVLGRSKRGFYKAEFSSDGENVTTLSDETDMGDMELRIYATRGAQKVKRVARDNFMSWFTRLRDGRLVTSSGRQITVKNGQDTLLSFGDYDFDARVVSKSDDGSLLACGGFDIRPVTWNRWRDFLDYTSEEDRDAWHGRATVWNIASGKMLQRIEGGKEIREVELSHDNKELAVIVQESMWWDSTNIGHVEIWPIP